MMQSNEMILERNWNFISFIGINEKLSPIKKDFFRQYPVDAYIVYA